MKNIIIIRCGVLYISGLMRRQNITYPKSYWFGGLRSPYSITVTNKDNQSISPT